MSFTRAARRRAEREAAKAPRPEPQTAGGNRADMRKVFGKTTRPGAYAAPRRIRRSRP